MANENKGPDPFSRTSAQLPPGENPSAMPVVSDAESIDTSETEDQGIETLSEGWAIQTATNLYNASTDYLNSNITNQWERNVSHFNNEHAPGTLYRRKNFKRSRIFRPKTRANVKSSESALANAAFSTLNLVNVSPVNPKDEVQTVAAAVHKAIMEHRLSYEMPWFLTTQGAFQSTKVYGVCISHQYWSYREDTDVIPAFDSSGKPVTNEKGQAMGYEKNVVRQDELCSDLIAPENFRFDPMCDWRNPAKSSPYLIHIMPMYAGEAQEMMEIAEDSKTGQKRWRRYSLAQILSTRRDTYDRTRQAREGRERTDAANNTQGNEFTTVWVHRNIVKVDGTDYEYYTLGTDLLLTDPEPLRDSNPWLREGERPYVVGYSTIEAFRNYPAGDVEQSAPLQEEINQVANQRMDNVKLVLNKRYFVRRGSQVDLDALIRNVPGGGVMMNDTEKDVNIVNTPDVTSSAYQEQGLLSQEFDDLVGGYTPANNQSNSVAGQQLGAASAGAVQDYGIKIFIETWMEPVLRQLQRLIAMYETDETILAIGAETGEIMKKLKLASVTDSLMMQNLYLRVDIGMGNTDPMRKVERIIFGAKSVGELPGMATRLKGKQIADSIYGALGYRDSSQFVMTDEEWQAFLEQNPPGPTEIDVKMRELDIRDADNAARDERERMKLDKDFQARMEEILAKQDMKLDELMAKFNQSAMSDQTQRDIAAARLQSDTNNRMMEAAKPPNTKTDGGASK